MSEPKNDEEARERAKEELEELAEKKLEEVIKAIKTEELEKKQGQSEDYWFMKLAGVTQLFEDARSVPPIRLYWISQKLENLAHEIEGEFKGTRPVVRSLRQAKIRFLALAAK